MKRRLLATFVLLIPFALSGCKDGSWNDYNTPDRFLNKAKINASSCSISINMDDPKASPAKDYTLEVRNALVDAGGFKKSDLISSSSPRFFSYINHYADGFVGLAPARFCIMSVYEDGFIKIDFEDVEEHKYAYFEMDAQKAYEINDLVYAKIPREKQMIEEDKSQAYLDGDVANYFTAMEKKASIKTAVYEINKKDNTKYSYDYYDNGELLPYIKGVEYTRTNKSTPSDAEVVFSYNLYDPNDKELSWSYHLYSTYDYVVIYYSYVNRLKDQNRVSIAYNISSIQGKSIYDKALEIVKV